MFGGVTKGLRNFNYILFYTDSVNEIMSYLTTVKGRFFFSFSNDKKWASLYAFQLVSPWPH